MARVTVDGDVKVVQEVDPEGFRGDYIEITITEEGLIFDAYGEAGLLGTTGRTFSEWFDHVAGGRN